MAINSSTDVFLCCGGPIEMGHTLSCSVWAYTEGERRSGGRVPVAVPDNTSVDLRMLGPGGAPTRTTILPEDAAGRKEYPVASGVLDYFPDALVAIAEVSKKGNDQHNPGLPLRWTRGKSADEADTMIRHFLQRGLLDTDGIRHSAKMAWRALALLQKEIEGEQSVEVNKGDPHKGRHP